MKFVAAIRSEKPWPGAPLSKERFFAAPALWRCLLQTCHISSLPFSG